MYPHPRVLAKSRSPNECDPVKALQGISFAAALIICLCGLFPTSKIAADSRSNTSGMLLPQKESNYQLRPYTGKMAPDDGQWVRPAKDYASTRYSTLDQINTSNVENLKLAFTFSTGLTRGHEAAPLVVNNTMYIVTPWPNKLYALDLTKPGAPMKWVYQPMPTPASKGVACCDVVNRGASYFDGKIYYNTLDDQVVSVDVFYCCWWFAPCFCFAACHLTFEVRT